MYLNFHSYYSLRYGTLSPERIIKLAKTNRINKLAITDINNSSVVLELVKLGSEEGIEVIAGIEFQKGDKTKYIGIAKNNEGFYELNEFLSYHNLNKLKLPDQAPEFSNVFIIYPFQHFPDFLNENEYVGINWWQLNKLYGSKISAKSPKLLALQPIVFEYERDFTLHKNLKAIDRNILYSQLENEFCASEHSYFIGPNVLLNKFSPHPDLVRNSERLLSDCSFDFNFKTLKNKRCYTESEESDWNLLRKLSKEGMLYRYGKNNTVAKDRVEHELDIIRKLGFSAYFLITWDIIQYSMSKGYYHVGRGSGANSIVAYCLKITDVDPIDLNLYFERFLNPKRSSPPDFDIDFSWKDRDDVTRYIFNKWGDRHATLLGATNTFKDKSIIRELGKVHGLPKEEIDSLVNDPGNPMNAGELTSKIISIGNQMTDFPNIRSIHAGGILISEEPITYYTALDLPPKGFPTTQWDMYLAEDIGFEKLDILSQRGIGHIYDCVKIVKENCNQIIDIHQVEEFKKDEKVKRLLQNGETNGCFYVESPAMRGLLKKLHCSDYLTLVAASSIIRPGVARSGMMKEYIKRFHNPNGFKYLHPVMEEQLSETYGVMVYQEDVLKICHHFAGLDLSDADVLRRAMSGKYRSRKEFQTIVNKFFSNCKSFGYTDTLTKEVWRQIESFAGYSFSKAHSASYAVESYQSMYLKAYFPIEFMVAVINNFGGFYHSWVYFSEAKRWGAGIELPCINRSYYKTHLEDKTVFTGFIHVANLERKIVLSLINEREINGSFRSLNDFISRVPIGKEQLSLLIRIGAFRFTNKLKSQLLWEMHSLLGKTDSSDNPKYLFPVETPEFKLPKLTYNVLEDVYDEIELLGFPITLSYFDMLETKFRGEIFTGDMINNIGRKVRMLGLLVTTKYTRTIKKEIMQFGTFYDAQGEFFDTVHFPNSLKQYPFRGHGIYLILGSITSDFGFPSVTVEKMAKLPLKQDPRY